ncbi:unnamed protein product [Cyprideis torosa]|uniref:MRN complex-interacting protein N-terminal domain-containing protein n=1 Tax=Cyprideis torosa TaxID=163714 RepID=A0A7R8WC88_9CRUS|nr:unnamed protein product [Cyprideis torosa]CAG0893173.1 unnamed protein product [Cyprideis torosa]
MAPQVFQVLQCFSCQTFQVQQKKLVPKWSCKMCSEKQSVQRLYFEGSGKDCRVKVQELNLKRAKVDNELESEVLENNFTLSTTNPPEEHAGVVRAVPASQSRWKEFISDDIDSELDPPREDLSTVRKKPKFRNPMPNQSVGSWRNNGHDTRNNPKTLDNSGATTLNSHPTVGGYSSSTFADIALELPADATDKPTSISLSALGSKRRKEECSFEGSRPTKQPKNMFEVTKDEGLEPNAPAFSVAPKAGSKWVQFCTTGDDTV